jgi:hypothetical protein
MKKIETKNPVETPPITIELSGRDAELLLVLIFDNTMDDCMSAASTSYGVHYTTDADQIDGMSDELFDLLDKHVRGE